LAVGPLQTQADADVRVLRSDAAIERELAAGQSHTYRLTLTPEQYAHIVIDQRGVDVTTTAFAPSGRQISIFDTSNTEGPESIWIVADEPGDVRLIVTPVSSRASPGRYEIRVVGLRPAVDQDRRRVATQKLLLEAETLTLEGMAESLRAAIPKYEAALEAWHALNETESEQDTLTDLAGTYQSLRDNYEARVYYTEALASFRASGNRRRESLTLNNLGLIDNDFGEYQSTLDHFNQALALFRAAGSRGNEATTLASIGLVYRNLGQAEKALDFYTQALTLYRTLTLRNGEAIALHGLGQIQTTLGDYRKAVDYYSQALPLFRTGGNRRREAQVLASLGWAHAVLGDRDQARRNLEDALSLSRVIGERGVEAQTLHSLGALHEVAGDHAQTADRFGQALALRQMLGVRAGQASSSTGLARIARAGGHLDEARDHIQRAIDRIESLRTAVARQELRSSYLASKQDEYELYVDLLMQMHRIDPAAGHAAAALEVTDRARARSLLDMLAESRADIRKDVDPELLDRERAVQRELNAKESARLQMLSGRHTDTEAAAIQKEVEALLAAYQEIQSKIRAASPRYAALTQPPPPRADDIRSLLDEDTLLIEYALGEPRSFLWAVSRGAVRSYELPGRGAIENPARRLHDLLGRGTQRVVRTQIDLAAAELSRMILEPIARDLPRKRLLIVTSGVLQYVPFAILPDPSPARTSQPLMVGHEIAYLPSASMLKLLRDDRPTRQATMAVAVLADPVFDRADPRTRNSPPRRTQRTRRTGLSDVQDRSSVSSVSSVSSCGGEV